MKGVEATLPPHVRGELDAFCDAIWLEYGLAPNTLAGYRSDLALFAHWLGTRGGALQTATHADLAAYLAELGPHCRSSSQRRLLSTWRRYYRHLLAKGAISDDPTVLIDPPPRAERFPKTLSEGLVESLLAAPDVDTLLGLRDRAMIEVIYAAGLRVSELVSLKIYATSLTDGLVRVTGKGNKERLVPVGDEAVDWLRRYIDESRPQLLAGKVCDEVFVTRFGTAMSRQMFWRNIKRYAGQVGIAAARISPHTLRHAFATHLVNHGADLRVVQLLLGHVDISTTEVYTHVARARLQALHEKHHPRG